MWPPFFRPYAVILVVRRKLGRHVGLPLRGSTVVVVGGKFS